MRPSRTESTATDREAPSSGHRCAAPCPIDIPGWGASGFSRDRGVCWAVSVSTYIGSVLSAHGDTPVLATFIPASVVCAIFLPLIADPSFSVTIDCNRGLRFWC